jgi:hypothetical protein
MKSKEERRGETRNAKDRIQMEWKASVSQYGAYDIVFRYYFIYLFPLVYFVCFSLDLEFSSSICSQVIRI